MRRSPLVRAEATPYGVRLRMAGREDRHCRVLTEEFPDHHLMLAAPPATRCTAAPSRTTWRTSTRTPPGPWPGTSGPCDAADAVTERRLREHHAGLRTAVEQVAEAITRRDTTRRSSAPGPTA